MARQNARDFMAEALLCVVSPQESQAWALRLEEAIYSLYLNDASAPYRRKVRSMAFNVSNIQRNPHWVRRLLQGEISVEQAVRQTPREIFPDHYVDGAQASFEREGRPQAEAPRSDSGAPCPRCHSRNTTYTLLQTRRADEGATEYWFCRDCERRWKGGG